MSDHDSPTPKPEEPVAPERDGSPEPAAEPSPAPEPEPLPGMANLAGLPGASKPAEPAADEPEVDLDFVPDGVDHQLDPNWVLASRLSGGIAVAVFGSPTLIGLIIAVFVRDWSGPRVPLVFGAWLVLVSGFLTWSQVGPALRYKRRRYRLDETSLRFRRGLVFHTEITVPYSRIQHTDVSRGPIERWFGLATLIVHTAGTDNASVSVDGLPSARAYRIRDLLLADAETGDAV